MKQKYQFLNQTLKGTKIHILLTLLLSAINSRLIIYVPMFIQYVLDGVIMGQEEVVPWYIRAFWEREEPISKIIVLSFFLVITNLLIFGVSYLRSKINTKFNLRINRNVKESVLKHVPRLEYEVFHQVDKADVMQRVNNDATTYAEFFNSQIGLFFDTIFIVSFAVSQTLQLNQTVGAFVGGICLFIILLSICFFQKSRPMVEDITEKNKEIIKMTTSAIQDSKMQKIFNRREKEIAKFQKLNSVYKKEDVKLAKLKVMYRITTHAVRNFKEPFILLIGGILVVKGEMTLAVVSLLLTYATKILDYVYETVAKLANINEFWVAYRKLSRLMQYAEEENGQDQGLLIGDIVFKQVTIKAGNTNLLENANFTIAQGENIAIIGDNGSGKTVLAKTLMGFYEYTGDILIGNTNIRDVSKASLRRYIGIVLQDTYLFSGTIRENLAITNKELETEELVQACKTAEIQEDIEKMDKKLDSVLETGGNNLSGGQKQRLAIARMVIANNKFIILDDSLSKLDTKTKIRILENIVAINKGMLIISHDIAVVESCDKVMFIRDKKIIIDTHENLLEKEEQYKQIIQMKQNTILEYEED